MAATSKPLGSPSAATRRGSLDPSDFALEYRFIKTLGEGSFGKVKLAVNVHTNEQFAVKILEKKRLAKEEDLTRAQREIKVLTLIRHPNIAQLYEVVNADKHIYLVLEHASGGELFDYIVAHKRVKEKEARVFFRQILSAVDYCHRNFFIHRDLKPENLLLDKDLKIKIIDFGFANSFQTGELMRTFCGSPAYAAPEMVKGDPYIGPKVDIWSLGVILFALTCGFLPFDDPNVNKLYAKIVKGEYKPPFFLSDSVRALIARMLVIDPAERATMDEIFADPWVNEGFDSPPDNGVPPRAPVTTIDDAAIASLASMGFEEAETRAAVLSNVPGLTLSAYYLVLEKRSSDEARADSLRAQLAAKAKARRTLAPPTAAPGLQSIGEDEVVAATSPSSSAVPASPATLAPVPIARRRHSHAVATADDAAAASKRFADLQASKAAADAAAAASAAVPTGATARRRGSLDTSAGEDADRADGKGKSKDKDKGKDKSKDKGKEKDKDKDKGKEKSKDKGKEKDKAKRAGEGGEHADHASAMAAATAAAAAAAAAAGPSQGHAPESDTLTPEQEAEMIRAHAAIASKRAAGRRLSLDPTMATRSGQEAAARRADEAASSSKLRTVKGPFSVATTSSKSPDELVVDVTTVLDANSIAYERNGYTFECTCEVNGLPIRFEMEICKIDRLSLNGLRLKRLTGDTWAYKRECLLLLSQMSL